MSDDAVRALARVMLASVFVVVGLQRVVSGFDALIGTAPPRAVTGVILSAAGVLLGVLIIAGWRLRALSVLAAAVLLLQAYLAHPFWLLSGPAFAAQLTQFTKNVALAGGFVLLGATAGPARRRLFR